jgi:spermidine/putrescine-binding protein
MERRRFIKNVAMGSLGLVAASPIRAGRPSDRLAAAQGKVINVLVWDEQQDVQVKSGAYKNYLGNAVAEFLG